MRSTAWRALAGALVLIAAACSAACAGDREVTLYSLRQTSLIQTVLDAFPGGTGTRTNVMASWGVLKPDHLPLAEIGKNLKRAAGLVEEVA
jgi:hypothetical protein